jgi:hypothetical protein
LQESEGQGPSAPNTKELYVRVPAAPLPSRDIELPKYSVAIQALLDKGNIMPEWDKFIEETAYHVHICLILLLPRCFIVLIQEFIG